MNEEQFKQVYGGPYFYQQLMTFWYMLSTEEEREANLPTDKIIFNFEEGEYVIEKQDLEKRFKEELEEIKKELEFQVVAEYILDHIEAVEQFKEHSEFELTFAEGRKIRFKDDTTDDRAIIQLLKEEDKTIYEILEHINKNTNGE